MTIFKALVFNSKADKESEKLVFINIHIFFRDIIYKYFVHFSFVKQIVIILYKILN